MNEELELKYITINNINGLQEKIKTLLVNNDYQIKDITRKLNCDDYFDTPDFDLYNQGGSLRIRKTLSDNTVKYKGTYKEQTNKEGVYSSRIEIEEKLQDNNFDAFKFVMQKLIIYNLNLILDKPILNSTTRRTDILLEKNNNQVYLSFDDTVYTNYVVNENMVSDQMIEVESANITLLNEINELILSNIEDISIIKQSKYERGINKTLNLNKTKEDNNKFIK